MAVRNYQLDPDQNYTKVVEGVGSATTKGIEVNIDLAKVKTKKQALLALEEMIVYITRDGFPPA